MRVKNAPIRLDFDMRLPLVRKFLFHFGVTTAFDFPDDGGVHLGTQEIVRILIKPRSAPEDCYGHGVLKAELGCGFVFTSQGSMTTITLVSGTRTFTRLISSG